MKLYSTEPQPGVPLLEMDFGMCPGQDHGRDQKALAEMTL